jgi:hypothetical protein
VGHATGAWPHALEHRAAIDASVGDTEPANVRGPLIIGIADRALNQLLKHPRAAVRLVTKDGKRIVNRLAANQVGQRTHLAGADPSMPMCRFVCHVYLAFGSRISTIGQMELFWLKLTTDS